MSLAQRGGLLSGFMQGFQAARESNLQQATLQTRQEQIKEDRKFRQEMFKEQISQRKQDRDVARENVEVNRNRNTLDRISRQEQKRVGAQGAFDAASSEVKNIQNDIKKFSGPAFKNLPKVNELRKQLDMALIKQKTAKSAVDTINKDISSLESLLSKAPQTETAPQPSPDDVTNQGQAEVSAVSETAQQPAEVAKESQMDLTNIVLGGKSVQDMFGMGMIPGVGQLTDKGTGETPEDFGAAEQLGVTPVKGIKFKGATQVDPKTGMGPIQSSKDAVPATEFQTMNEAIKTQLGSSLFSTIERKGLDEKEHLTELLSGSINRENATTNNLTKVSIGINEWLKTPEVEGLMKTAEGRKNIRTLLDTMASDLSRRASEQKGTTFERAAKLFSPFPEDPDDPIARKNIGSLARNIFRLRDEIDRIDAGLNQAVDQAGGLPIDADISMPQMTDEDLDFKQNVLPAILGRKKKSVKPPKRR